MDRDGERGKPWEAALSWGVSADSRGSRAAMLIRIRVLNEQLPGTGFTDQPRS